MGGVEDYIITNKSRQNWIIAIVSAAVFMFSLDYSIVNISLPVMAKYFKASISNVSRVPLVYLIVVTSTVLLFGKLGDIKGFKKIFITGLFIFVTGTFLCGIAPTLNILLSLRVYQCIGEAMFSPISIAIATVFLPSNVKGKALGFMATAQGLGFSLGPVLGGFINDHFGWHNIFFVNIPLGILMIIASFKIIPSRQPAIEGRRVHAPPFLNRDFAFAALSAFSVIFVYMGLIFLLPFYLNMVRGISIMGSGLILMLPALMVIIFAPIAGLICDRFGSRLICVFGVTMTTAAFFIFSLFTPKTPISMVLAALVLAGIAIGFFLPANNKLVMIHAPMDKQGMASAVYKILNSIGGVFGIAILPFIITRKISAAAAHAGIAISEIKHHPDIVMMGFDAAFKFTIFICVMGLVFAILARDKKELNKR